MKNTLRICRDENLLNEYLKTRETEVEGIMLTLFDQDRVTEIWKKEYMAEVQEKVREEIREEVRKESKLLVAIDNVKSLMQNMNLSAEQALQALNIAGSERQQVLAALN